MLKGSLQVNNGYWCVSFRIKDKNGKSRQKQLSTGIKAIVNGKQVNKRKAEDKMKEILEQYENTTFESGNVLLCDYVSDWIERDKARIQSTTYDGYVHMFKKHIEPYFKDKKLKLKDVKPMHLERYYSDKLEEGISPNTIIKHSAIIRTALQDAMKNGLIKTNPADFAEKPKRQKPKHDFYTGEEITIPLDPALSAIDNGKKYLINELSKIVYGLKLNDNLYEYVYDTVCKDIDNMFSIYRFCDFRNDKCLSQRHKSLFTNNYPVPDKDGCCFNVYRKCEYLKEHGGCEVRCLACKLYTCPYITKLGVGLYTSEILLMKAFFNNNQRRDSVFEFFQPEEKVLKKIKKHE